MYEKSWRRFFMGLVMLSGGLVLLSVFNVHISPAATVVIAGSMALLTIGLNVMTACLRFLRRRHEEGNLVE